MDEYNKIITKYISVSRERDILSIAAVAYVLYNSPGGLENVYRNTLNATKAFVFIQGLPFTLLLPTFFHFN